MVILSIVSYGSLSLVMILIDMFGPTNSELVECTSLVTSILFSYYFISSGSEFVFVHFIALSAFIGALVLNIYGLQNNTSIILHKNDDTNLNKNLNKNLNHNDKNSNDININNNNDTHNKTHNKTHKNNIENNDNKMAGIINPEIESIKISHKPHIMSDTD